MKRKTWKRLIPVGGIVAVVVGAVTIALCSGGKTEPAPPPVPPPPPALVIADSIPCGPYFHEIVDVVSDRSGSIFVLDGGRLEVSVFDGAGGYRAGLDLTSIPRGELQAPIGFTTLSDGRLAISDPKVGGILLFEADLTYGELMDGFTYMAPWNISSFDGGFAGAELFMEGTEAGYRVCSWSNDGAIAYVLSTSFREFSRSNASSRVGVYMDVPLVTASGDGRVFTIPRRSGEALLQGFDSRGNLVTSISVTAPLLVKPSHLRESELRLAETLFTSGSGWQPDSFLPVVSGMGVDSLNRLWLQRGTEELPVFDVYDMEGGLLYTIAVEDEALRGWEIAVSEKGVFAWPGDPLQRQMVYMLEFRSDPMLEPPALPEAESR